VFKSSKNLKFIIVILVLVFLILGEIGFLGYKFFGKKPRSLSEVSQPFPSSEDIQRREKGVLEEFEIVSSEREIIVKRSKLMTHIIFFLDYTGDLKEKNGNVWVLEENGDRAFFTVGEETTFYTYGEDWEKLKIEEEEVKVGDRVAIMVRTAGFETAEKISKGDLRGLTVVEVDKIR